MKKIILIALTISSSAGFAAGYPATVEPQGYEGYYVSWCEENQVVQEGTDGKSKVLVDCAASGQVCVMTQYMSRRAPVYAGVCEEYKD